MGWELYRASVRGDLTEVERLLDCGADVNWQEREVWDILYQTVLCTVVVDYYYILQCGWTPIFAARRKGHETVSKLLFNWGADVDKAEESELIWDGEQMGQNLYRASYSGDLTKVERLLDCGADVNWQQYRVWDIFYYVNCSV